MILRLLARGRTGRRTAIPARTVETPRRSSVNLFKGHTTSAPRRDEAAGGQKTNCNQNPQARPASTDVRRRSGSAGGQRQARLPRPAPRVRRRAPAAGEMVDRARVGRVTGSSATVAGFRAEGARADRRRGFGAPATACAAIKSPARSCVGGASRTRPVVRSRSMQVPGASGSRGASGKTGRRHRPGFCRHSAVYRPAKIDVRPASERTAA